MDDSRKDLKLEDLKIIENLIHHVEDETSPKLFKSRNGKFVCTIKTLKPPQKFHKISHSDSIIHKLKRPQHKLTIKNLNKSLDTYNLEHQRVTITKSKSLQSVKSEDRVFVDYIENNCSVDNKDAPKMSMHVDSRKNNSNGKNNIRYSSVNHEDVAVSEEARKHQEKVNQSVNEVKFLKISS